MPGHVSAVPLQTPSSAQPPAAPAQTVPAGAGVQTSVTSLHPATQPETGQRRVTCVQAPAALHASVAEQKSPSLHGVPAGLSDHEVRLVVGSHHRHWSAGFVAPAA